MQRSLKTSSYLLVILLVVMLILAGCGASIGIPQKVDVSDVFASWPVLLTTAQQEARKMDKGAVLMWVLSHDWQMQCQPGNSKSSTLNYIFLAPSGMQVSVGIEDTVPPSIGKAAEYGSLKSLPSQEYLTKLNEALASVKLGPREICERTLTEGTGYSQGPQIDLYLDFSIQDKSTQNQSVAPARWIVQYRNGSGEHKTVWLSVSAQTGEILARKYDAFLSTSTSTP